MRDERVRGLSRRSWFDYISRRAEEAVGKDADFTALLLRAHAGEADALEVVWRSAYDELHAMARGIRRGYDHRSTPSPTTIVHEAFLKTFGGRAVRGDGASPSARPGPDWDSRAHFFGSFARAMAQFLIDWRRTATRLKRGGGAPTVGLGDGDGDLPSLEPLDDLNRALREVTPALVEELERLQADAPELASVVWLRYMAALSLDDTATILGIAPRTVSKRWNAGRAILRRELGRRLRIDPATLDGGAA
jgi:RNA polymerase sigma factor (TIGR02999 family)